MTSAALLKPNWGDPVRILNPDLRSPDIGSVDVPDVGECVARSLPDHQVVAFPGHLGALSGIDLARATVANLAVIDAQTVDRLLAEANGLVADLLALVERGIQRPSAVPSELQ